MPRSTELCSSLFFSQERLPVPLQGPWQTESQQIVLFLPWRCKDIGAICWIASLSKMFKVTGPLPVNSWQPWSQVEILQTKATQRANPAKLFLNHPHAAPFNFCSACLRQPPDAAEGKQVLVRNSGLVFLSAPTFPSHLSPSWFPHESYFATQEFIVKSDLLQREPLRTSHGTFKGMITSGPKIPGSVGQEKGSN